jgi:hypothetical protein
MSTIVAQTLSNGTISTSTANVINGAKAWVSFNGTGTVAIRASYNVSSITDNGTGDYTVNFTNSFADVNYATTVTAGSSGPTSSSQAGSYTYGNPLTSKINVGTNNAGGTLTDMPFVGVAIFR